MSVTFHHCAKIPKINLKEEIFILVIKTWWCVPLILALERKRQRQADLCEFGASLVCMVNSRTASPMQKETLLQNKQK